MSRKKQNAKTAASQADNAGPGSVAADQQAAANAPANPSDGELIFWYKNHRGEEGYRRVEPIMFYFGSTEWHPDPQMLMRAFDREKEAIRDFAVADMKGFVGGSETMVARSNALQCWAICEELREGEASSVELLCDNPDFNGQPNNAVSVYGEWTKYHPKRFAGDTMLDALKVAQAAKKEAQR